MGIILWFVFGLVWVYWWVVGLLGFLGDDFVFDVDFLWVGFGVVDFVCGLDYFVVILLIVVEYVIFVVVVLGYGV